MTREVLWQVDAQPGSPWHNMAVDMGLLGALSRGELNLPTIRIYQWDRAAVSMGRLQPEEPVHRRYPGLPCVRRPTGGRAVLHGGDLTITVAFLVDWLPEGAGSTILSSYRLLMTGLRAALAECGQETEFGTEKARGGVRGEIDCFDLAAGCDLIDAGSRKKLVGSAQRRENGALLQQMSLPLALLPDLSHFLRALRRGFAGALQLEEWMFIDTNCAL